MKNKLWIIFLLLSQLISCQPAWAHPINMKILAEIESSNNPKAYNKKSLAKGLYQITPIVWKQFAMSQGVNIANSSDSLFYEEFSTTVANWYLDWLSQRCNTVDEILIAWNWGIGNLRKWKNCSYENNSPDIKCFIVYELPKETQDFLRKYHEKETLLSQNKE